LQEDGSNTQLKFSGRSNILYGSKTICEVWNKNSGIENSIVLPTTGQRTSEVRDYINDVLPTRERNALQK
jgi:hypothetical protein